MKYYLCRTEGRIVLETTQAGARSIDPNHKPIEIPTDKDGLRKFAEVLFNRNPGAATTIAGDGAAVNEETAVSADQAPPPPSPPAQPAISYTEASIKIDEDFEKLPLARQLGLAAIALENARGTIKPLA